MSLLYIHGTVLYLELGTINHIPATYSVKGFSDIILKWKDSHNWSVLLSLHLDLVMYFIFSITEAISNLERCPYL